jgi:biotin synthase
VSTRCYQDRLDTLDNIRAAGIKTCCGGIIGMGESRDDRVGLLLQLANLPVQPQSVPINRLVPIHGTPLGQSKPIDDLEFIRTIAVARIMMPKSKVRLSAGRESMNEAVQTLCYFAGANSIFTGDKLLTAPNSAVSEDMELLARLGLKVTEAYEA